MSLYNTVPKQKGATDLVSFLPPLKQAEEQIGINSLFSRNYLAGTNRTRKLTCPSIRFCVLTDQLSSEPHVRRRRYAQAHERQY